MNRSETISLLGFVPALVVQYLSENKKAVKLPDKQTFSSVVMFADISGFTNLTETLHKLGNEGCELTAFAINRYMELLVKAISRSGGDIFKFAGDAMIVVWPPPDLEGKTSLETLCRQAIQSALDIQAKLHDTYILKNIKLSVKIGFGIGEISIVYTGGIFGRCEYLASGDPLIQAFNSEHHATKGGETLISKELFHVVKEFFEVQENPQDNPDCYHVIGVKGKVRMKADALIIKNNLDMLKFEKVRPQLLGYIPAALLPYIENGQESWGNELRSLTIMFLNLGVDLSCTSSDEGLQIIQNVMQTVQKCIYMHEGSLNKLLMDDKGSTLIVVFGLPPMCHQDDAARAILTAFLLQKELKKLQCSVSIGIATGKVFAGVVGTSGSRREYSVLGDEVNLSARLMQVACTEKKEKIIVCGTTREQSSGAITSVFYKEVSLKGKANTVSIYIPLETVKEQRENPILAMIKVHQESSLLKYEDIRHLQTMLPSDEVKTPQTDQNNDTQVLTSITRPQPIIGNESNIKRCLDSFTSFLSRKVEMQLLILRGAFGVGKSHILKICLAKIDQMIQKKQFGAFKYNESPYLLVTVLNPVDRNLKFNGLRKTLRQLISIISARQNKVNQLSFLNEFFEPIRNQYEEYFKEFCSLINPLLFPIQHFPSPINEPSKQEVEALTAYVTHLFCAFQELKDSDYDETIKFSSSQKQTEQLLIAPIILVFPNCEHLDQATFKALRHIIQKCPKIMIVLLWRDKQTEIPMVGLKTQEQISEKVEDGISKMSEDLEENEIVEILIENLSRQASKSEYGDQYKKFIKLHFGIEEFKESIDMDKLQTEKIEDEQEDYFSQRSNQNKQRSRDTTFGNAINSREQCIRLKMMDHLLFYEGKHDLININFSEYVYHFLYLKTKGHALATKQWLNMLLQKNLLKIEKNIATVSLELKKIFEHEETIVLDVPFIYSQINGQIIDKLGCFKCLILKAASVIGDMFDLNTLAKVHPFQENINAEKLFKLLEELVQMGIIEVMDQQEDNQVYRFTFPFFREAIYQRMTYAQRRLIHLLVVEAYQLMPQVYDYDEKISEKKLMVQWELTEQKSDPDETKQNVSHKAKRAFIVKRLRQLLTSENYSQSQVLFDGQLKKKSEQNITWSDRYCQLTGSGFAYFYNSKSEEKENSIPLGAFNYKHVQSIRALEEGPTKAQKLFSGQKNVLQIKVSQWIKRSNSQIEDRKFYFSTNNEEELEQWIIYLEFMKAKATYEEFVEQFGKIPFPLQSTQNNNVLMKVTRKDSNQKFIFRNSTGNQQKSRVSKTSIIQKVPKNFLADITSTSATNNNNLDDFVNNWQQEILDLQPFLNEFMVKALFHFYAHIFEVSINNPKQQKIILGQRLKIMVQNPQIFKVLTHGINQNNLLNSELDPITKRLLPIQEDQNEQNNIQKKQQNIHHILTDQLIMRRVRGEPNQPIQKIVQQSEKK